MSGVTPCISMNKIAARLDELDTGESITEALDEVEYLFEVTPPELQEPAETLTWTPPVCQVNFGEEDRLQSYIRPVDGDYPPGLYGIRRRGPI